MPATEDLALARLGWDPALAAAAAADLAHADASPGRVARVGRAEADRAVEVAREAAAEVEIVVTSAVTGAGLDRLRTLARAGRTVALIGASGVGKSRLVNGLVGESVQAIGDVRENDQRGRHTTTARELVALPEGGWLIDTPGLSSVALWDADEGLSPVFSDVEAPAARCRFTDCSHGPEPDCAARAAIERGERAAGRLEHYRRLDR